MSIRNFNLFQVFKFSWNRLFIKNNNLLSLSQKNVLLNYVRNKSYTNPTGTPGSGAGKGGGGGGSIRESGGSLGQYGTAQEEQFFFNKQRELLEKIKKKLKEGKIGDVKQKEEKHD
ncbi:unnamed protein product, partial [Brenthis ino]